MGSGYSLKKSAREPGPPFTTNLECSIQAGVGVGGTQPLGSLGPTEQRPAVAAGTPARPARCVYVRNSDPAGVLCNSLRFRWPRRWLKSARVCKSAPSEVGKCPLAKEICLVRPTSDSDCSYQLRETDFSGISPALRDELVCIRGQLPMEASLSRLLAFPFTANSCIGSHLASSPRVWVSGDTHY